MDSFPKTVMKCPECPYDKARNLGTHLFFVHGYSKKRISEWRMNMKAATLSNARHLYDIFRCQFCPKTYRRQNSCRAHERTVHCVSFSTRQKCVPCPIINCEFTTTALLDLCAHAKESHSQLGDFSIREARFENMSLFQAWRVQYEEMTQTVLATESVNNNAAAGTTLRYLRCAQLEAQIRKVRNQMRQSELRGNERRRPSVLAREDEEDEDGEDEDEGRRKEVEEGGGGEEDEEETVGRDGTMPQETTVSVPRRSPRKRKMDGAEEHVREAYDIHQKKEEVGYGRSLKKLKEEEEESEDDEEDQEEEEIDVEQLDDGDISKGDKEAGPSTSAAISAAVGAAKKRSLIPHPVIIRNYEDPEDEERAPRLLRASSAHLANAEMDDDDELTAEPMPMPLNEMERRMNPRHCTAHMRVLVLRSGAVHVEYCGAHLGHDIMRIHQSRPSERRIRDAMVKPSTTISKEIEEDIEKAKQRRKGRRETENRWRTETRMRTERAQFSQLLESYEDIGANVELYEAEDSEDMYDDDLQVEEIIEEEVVGRHHTEEDDEEDLVEDVKRER